jgi:hypothetical protein
MKINKRILFFGAMMMVAGLMLPGLSIAQSHLKFGLGIKSGLEAGWWIYNKGFNDTLPGSHMGYDRTHLSFVIPVELTFALRTSDLIFNFGAGSVRIGDNVMIGSEDRRRGRTRYDVAAGEAVNTLHAFVQGGPALLKKPKYTFFPTLALGMFSIETTHPDKAQFKKQWFWKISLENYISPTENLDLTASLAYTNMKISTTNDAPKGAEHDIYSIGVNVGAILWLKH